MRTSCLAVVVALLVAGCAETSIQPLTQTSFKVATQAAPACGAQGARDVAFKSAAIEVIKRGGDRFIIVGDQSGSRITGGSFNAYGGFQTYSSNLQDMVVQMVPKTDPQYGNALSARQTLGADWQAIVSKGTIQTCTE